jgi:hypothetical protein
MDIGKYKNTKTYASRREDREMWEAHQAEERRMYEQFRADLLDELDITGHPKAELLFEMAWRAGHADGYASVVYHAEELVELLR